MEERAYGKLEWFFYIIILPLLFTCLILGLVLQFMGYNVTGKLMSIARQTPVIGSMLPADEATKKQQSELRKLQAQLDEANKSLATTKTTNDLLQQDVNSRNAELEKLKQKEEADKKLQADKKAVDDYWKGKAKTYTEMSAKSAASILSKIPAQEARAILDVMQTDVRAAIMEKMDPKTAARLESEGALRQSADPYPYVSEKAKMYGSMSPSKAASIISELPISDARGILSQMTADTKAPIIEQMDPKVAASIESDYVKRDTPAKTGTSTSQPGGRN